MRFIYFIVAFLFISTGVIQAQEERKLVQFSGVLVSADSLDQVSYASIVDKTTGKGTMSDYEIVSISETAIIDVFEKKPSEK